MGRIKTTICVILIVSAFAIPTVAGGVCLARLLGDLSQGIEVNQMDGVGAFLGIGWYWFLLTILHNTIKAKRWRK